MPSFHSQVPGPLKPLQPLLPSKISSQRSRASTNLWVSRVLGVLAFLCFGVALVLWQSSQSRQEALAALSPLSPLSEPAGTSEVSLDSSQNVSPTNTATAIPTQEDWEGAQNAFPGLSSWVEVEGTNVSSPVMQAQEDDPDWFLDHNESGAYDESGLPYLDYHSNATAAVRVVYGHNLGWGTEGRFSDLAERWKPEAFGELGAAAWLVPGETTHFFTPLCAMKVTEDETQLLGLGLSKEALSPWLEEILGRLAGEDPSLPSLQGTSAANASELAHAAQNVLVLVTCSGEGFSTEQRSIVIFVEPGEPPEP